MNFDVQEPCHFLTEKAINRDGEKVEIKKDLPYPTEGNCFASARVWVLLVHKMAGEALSCITLSNSRNPVVFFDITIKGQVFVLNFLLYVCSLVGAVITDLVFHGCLSKKPVNKFQQLMLFSQYGARGACFVVRSFHYQTFCSPFFMKYRPS